MTSIPVNILKGLEIFDQDCGNKCVMSEATEIAMYLETPQMHAIFDLCLQEDPGFINERDDNGFVPLHWAVAAGYSPGYLKLLDSGAQINMPTVLEGFTPLMLSCKKGMRATTASDLLDRNANLRAKAKNSATAFHIAVASGSRDCMRLLILNGANPFTLLEDGRSALDLAENEEMKTLVYSCYRSAILREEKSMKSCANCQCTNVKLDRCGDCYVTFYCNRSCQLEHWKSEHKDDCDGNITVSIAKPPSKGHLKSKFRESVLKHDATFVVQVSQTPTGCLKVTNRERSIDAILNENKAKFEHIYYICQENNLNEDNSLLFWAKYADSTKKELCIFHSIPIFKSNSIWHNRV